MIDKMLWIMVGAPGSGKSWVARHVLMRGPGWRYVSRDEVRFAIVGEEEEYFSHENKVYREFIHQIMAALNEEGVFNVIADATHLNYTSRHKLLNALGKMDGVGIIAVVVQNDIQEMVENNEKRSGRSCVPRQVLYRMNSQMTDPATDPIKYDGIIYIDNRQKERE